MKKIHALTEEEKRTLEQGYLNSPKAHFRNRCHSILLSIEGYKVSEIALLYKVRTRTIYTWFNRWESNGISGLILLKGRGVKAKLDQLSPEEFDQVKEALKLDPQSLKRVCQVLSDALGFKISKYMLKRVLKKNSNTLGDALESV
jgi:transposase